jgi:hypothetical protein
MTVLPGRLNLTAQRVVSLSRIQGNYFRGTTSGAVQSKIQGRIFRLHQNIQDSIDRYWAMGHFDGSRKKHRSDLSAFPKVYDGRTGKWGPQRAPAGEGGTGTKSADID